MPPILLRNRRIIIRGFRSIRDKKVWAIFQVVSETEDSLFTDTAFLSGAVKCLIYVDLCSFEKQDRR